MIQFRWRGLAFCVRFVYTICTDSQMLFWLSVINFSGDEQVHFCISYAFSNQHSPKNEIFCCWTRVRAAAAAGAAAVAQNNLQMQLTRKSRNPFGHFSCCLLSLQRQAIKTNLLRENKNFFAKTKCSNIWRNGHNGHTKLIASTIPRPSTKCHHLAIKCLPQQQPVRFDPIKFHFSGVSAIPFDP